MVWFRKSTYIFISSKIKLSYFKKAQGTPESKQEMTLTVNLDSFSNATRIDRFRASTGLSPVFSVPDDGHSPPIPGQRNADYLLSADEFINIALIGSLPKGKEITIYCYRIKH